MSGKRIHLKIGRGRQWHNFVDTRLKVDHKRLNRTRVKKRYVLILSNHLVLIGSEFDVMRVWKKNYRDKRIIEMAPTKSKITGPRLYGLDVMVTSLSAFNEHK